MIIYKTINKINGKIYIGQDIKNNPSYFGSGKLILKALAKYDRSNFIKEILETCSSIEELNEREIFWIKNLDACNREKGYNLHEGGRGMTPERRANIGKSLKGRVFSEEHKRKIGEKTSKFHSGRKRSEETKKKLAESTKNRTEEQKIEIAKKLSKVHKGKKISPEQKKKISDTLKKRNAFLRNNKQ